MRIRERIGKGLTEARQWLKTRTEDPFAFKVYGDSLLTPRVSSEMRYFTIILVVQLLVDWWAWGRAWSYGLPNSYWLLPTSISFGIALAILVFDRQVVVVDTSGSRTQWWPLLLRGVLLFFISFITAVPVELAVFQSEIEGKFSRDEAEATTTLRQHALHMEDTRFSQAESTAMKEQEAVAKSPIAISLNESVNQYRAERAIARKALEDAQAVEATRQQEAIDQQRLFFNAEADGTSGSGKYGYRDAAKAKEKVLQDLQAVKARYDVEATEALNEFDAATAEGIKEREEAVVQTLGTEEASAKAKVAEVRANREKKLAAVQTMNPDQLAREYGGSWRVSRGFLDRFRELSTMADKDTKVYWAIWGCRFIMLLMGLLVLGMKAMSSKEFKWYYSLAAQAANGQEQATVKLAEAIGYADAGVRKALGFSHEVRDWLEDLGDARRTLAGQYQVFRQRAAEALKGECGLSIEAVHAELLTLWNSLMLNAIEKLEEVEDRAGLQGVAMPSWPADLGTGDDPRHYNHNRPWEIPVDELEKFGWCNPGPPEQEKCFQRVLDARCAIHAAHNTFEMIKRGSCLERDEHGLAISFPYLVQRLRQAWVDEVVPTLTEFAKAERACKNAGIEVPGWPTGLTRPNPLDDSAWQLKPEDLVKLGWEDPAPRLKAADDARSGLIVLRREVEDAIQSMDKSLAEIVPRRIGAPLADLVRQLEASRRVVFYASIAPTLDALERNESTLRSVGQEPIAWTPCGFDPNWVRECWRLDETDLREFGWTGPKTTETKGGGGTLLTPAPCQGTFILTPSTEDILRLTLHKDISSAARKGGRRLHII